MSHFNVFPAGPIGLSASGYTHVASGDSLLGQVVHASGNKYRLCMATDGAILPGQVVSFKLSDTDDEKYVVLGASASGVGEATAGLMVGNCLQGRSQYVQFEGIGLGMTSAANIAAGDPLVASSSGTLEETTSAGLVIKGAKLFAVALVAGGGLGTTSTTKVQIL